MLSRGWFIVAILFAITVVAAFATGYSLLWKAAYFFVILGALSWAWVWLNVRGLTVERESPDQRAQIGQTITERITIRNASPLPKPYVEIRDGSDLPGHQASVAIHLPARDFRRWRVKTTCTQRGRFRLGPLTVVATDPAGLFQREEQISGASSLLVYPRTVPIPDFTIPGGDLSGESRVKQWTHAVTPNASGIREYQPGDSLNRIHWLSTARTNRMMVKDFELDPSSEVWIVLDLQRSVHLGSGDDSTEEYGVTIAASIARRLIETNRS
ncbi:MAG: DUF58 domain-containing protein, partial [Dehalococcoidia bacterium]|nr:DUF58 domain-containing protein [Dehalococcoidia bacterium]